MIRPYELHDKKELVEIFNLNTPIYFDPKEVNDFEEYLKQHSATYLVIEYENKIVGGAGYDFQEKDNAGRITWIFFHPNYTGLGLGKKMVERCLSILKLNLALEKVVVTTSQLAYKFFDKFGFILKKLEKNYWGPGLDLYLMELQIDKNS
ncbi:GNAT family N-acetyltransferase [uncultured Aquimarina sp.]|uniref:GNAT family N-acetyltransferase n=1 Tax=uncultured Aquimarina sp. TaxID=575652 RepID=UPI00260ADD4F|nr:GNAT family N-acetyltransferase [uncultured Aquimarina sp.]